VATFLLKGWDSGTPLHELTVESIVAWAVRVRDEGYKGASGAIRHRSTQSLKEKDIPLLARCFRVAGVSSPIPDAVGRLGKSLKAKRKPPKMFSSLEEAGAVIGRIRRYGTPECGRDADILSLVLVTGARAGEMERLMAGDINIPGRTMALDSRKSDSRVLVIPQVAMPIVARLLERADGGPIVPGGMQELKTICTRWKRRLKDPRITCRALRHTFCTFSQEAGVAPSIVKSAMGHTSLRTTTRDTHSRAAAHQAAFDLVGELALGSPQLERKTECLS
jgi:integrase